MEGNLVAGTHNIGREVGAEEVSKTFCWKPVTMVATQSRQQ